MELQERIFDLLKQRGKTAKDLGDYISVKPSSISAWKNGESYPSSKYIPKISEFLNVSPTFLFTGENDTYTPPQITPGERAVFDQIHPLSEAEKFKLAGALPFIRMMQEAPITVNTPERERATVGLFKNSTSRE